jgi:hypothetical protein
MNTPLIILPLNTENCHVLSVHNIRFTVQHYDDFDLDTSVSFNGYKHRGDFNMFIVIEIFNKQCYWNDDFVELSDTCQLRRLLQDEKIDCLYHVLKYNIYKYFDPFDVLRYIAEFKAEKILDVVISIVDKKYTPECIVNECISNMLSIEDCTPENIQLLIDRFPTCDYSNGFMRALNNRSDITKILFDLLTPNQKSNLNICKIINALEHYYDIDTIEYLLSDPNIKFKPNDFYQVFTKKNKYNNPHDPINQIISVMVQFILDNTLGWTNNSIKKFIVKLCISKDENLIPDRIMSFICHFHTDFDTTIQILKHTKHPIIEQYWLSTLR